MKNSTALKSYSDNLRSSQQVARLFALTLISLFYFTTATLAQNDTPCECSQRWERGDKWDGAGGIIPPGADPNGIIRCGNGAQTQSNINVEYQCKYNPSEFMINLPVGGCVDPLNPGSTVSPIAPTPTKPIIWFNFDTRAGVMEFQAQWNDNNAADDIGWALYYSTAPTASAGAAPHYQSGDCGALQFYLCGVESGNTWYMIAPPSAGITNWYLAFWDQKGDNDLDINNFKARKGCGTATVACLEVVCPDPDGGDYQCLSDIPSIQNTEAGIEVVTNCPGTVSYAHSDAVTGSCLTNDLQVARTTTITFTPSDGSPAINETCTIVYYVDDTTAPVAPTPPAAASYQCAANVPAPGSLTATDNCSGNITVTGADTNNGGTGCPGSPLVITRTWTFSDACGNSSSVSQTITVIDNTAPVAPAAPAAASYQCATNVPAPGSLTATDNCSGNITVTGVDTNNGGTGCPGSPLVITRTWTFSDACGNSSSVSQTITVIDTQGPNAFDPADVTNVSCVGAIPCPLASDPVIAGVISAIQNGSSDCHSFTVALKSATALRTCSLDVNGNYTFGRTFTFRATDACGNYSDVDVTFSGACQPLCTFTQGAWGNNGGAPAANYAGFANDQVFIDHLLLYYAPGGKIRIGNQTPGSTAATSKYLDITSGAAVLALLPGGGTPAALASIVGCSKIGYAKCNPTGNDGALKNTLATQTVAMHLNMLLSQYSGLNLGNENLNCIPGIPADVLARLTALGIPQTVAGLLDLNNRFLGGLVTTGVTGSSLTGAADIINQRWHECAQPGGSCNAPLLLAGVVENSFDAWKSGQHVNLRWIMSNSRNVDHFVVERSLDGVDYQLLTTVNVAEGDQPDDYSAIDFNPEPGVNHYQLVAHLKNGEVFALPEQQVEFKFEKAYSIIPNPAQNEAYVDLSLLTNRKDVTLVVTNLYGQAVITKQLDVVQSNFERLDLSQLGEGIYFVSVKVGREIYTNKLIIARGE